MAPHGKLDVIWVGNTLFVNIDEPINIEAAVLFSKKIQAAVKSKNLTQWNRYVTLSPTMYSYVRLSIDRCTATYV